MQRNKLILHRFCSREEYIAYRRGEELTNNTDHYRGGRGGSISLGFCFFSGNVAEWARRLNGLVSFDVLLTVLLESTARVFPSFGVYADYANERPGQPMPRKLFREYCTESYSRDSFRFISADFTYRANPHFLSLEQRLKLFPHIK